MSEESPEKVETQPKESVTKKKAAKKRGKAPEAKAIEKESGEPNIAENPASGSEEESLTPEPRAAAGATEENRPAREEGETPTENPSVRRISSKRQSPSETPPGDDTSEQTATIGEPAGSSDAQGKKRRRRRRKGQGGDGDDNYGGNEGGNSGRNEGGNSGRNEGGNSGRNEGGNSGRSDENRPPPRPIPRQQIDPEKVEKKAWKIFLSEVSEEGLALVSDQDAKEIGRRSFRLAEIFLEEASKRQ